MNNIKLRSILRGVLVALALSIVFSMAAGMLYHVTSLTDRSLPWFAAAVLAVSSFFGSASAGRNAGINGIYHGVAVGIVFFIVVWIAGSIFMAGASGLGVICKFITAAFAGALGGMVGVGLS